MKIVKKRKLRKSNALILPIDPLAIVEHPYFQKFIRQISPVKPMPKLEKRPPFDLEKALEDNERKALEEDN